MMIQDNRKTGFIRLFRSMRNKSWYHKSEHVHLWIHLLLSATHRPVEYLLNGKTIILQPGQFVTGRKRLSSETGIHESKIQRILKLFESEQQIEQQTHNKCRVITIVEWSNYQHFMNEVEPVENGGVNNKRTSNRTTSEQQVNNNRTTTEQQLNTKQEHKNLKEQKEQKKEIKQEAENFENSEIPNDAPLHTIASYKMIDFLNSNKATTNFIVNAAKYSGNSEQLNDEIHRFFSYYSESPHFLKKAIQQPMLITGKLQYWLSNSKHFKQKTTKHEKGNSKDFGNAIDETLSEW